MTKIKHTSAYPQMSVLLMTINNRFVEMAESVTNTAQMAHAGAF